jgi:pSer/pThr/pTyr-binding forkhead associated (FHA) protein
MDVNLVLLKKNGSHKFFSLPNSVTVIGRRHSCDLCIPLMSVSRKHCQLNCDNEVLKIRDLNSRNGTYLNGKRIDEAVIQAGDSIKIGPLTFVLQIDGQPETITEPDLAAQSSSRQNAAKEDTVDEQLDNFAELDELNSLEETGSA